MRPIRTRRPGGVAGLALALIGCLLAAGCAGGPGATEPRTSPSAAATPLVIAITISGGTVTPNGQKIDVPVGQRVDLSVTSDTADEIHAHTGGDGFELEVPAGQTTTGGFTLDSAGSFEVESHHLEKTIVILNAR